MKTGIGFRRAIGAALVVVMLAALAAPAMAVGQSTTLAKKGAAYVVAVHGVNVRTGPGMAYSIKGVAKRGMKIYFVSESRGWWLMRDGKGHTGYVDKQFLSPVNAPRTGSYKVTQKVTVRDYPKSHAKRIGKLGKGAGVTMLMQNGDWALISYKGNTGYIPAKYLKK